MCFKQGHRPLRHGAPTGVPLNHLAVVGAQLHHEYAESPREILRSFAPRLAAGLALWVQGSPIHQTVSNIMVKRKSGRQKHGEVLFTPNDHIMHNNASIHDLPYLFYCPS